MLGGQMTSNPHFGIGSVGRHQRRNSLSCSRRDAVQRTTVFPVYKVIRYNAASHRRHSKAVLLSVTVDGGQRRQAYARSDRTGWCG